MSINVLYSIVVGAAGLASYAMLPQAKYPKASNASFAAFVCGLLITLYVFSGATLHVR